MGLNPVAGMSVCLMISVCCRVELSATDRSLIQRDSTECGLSERLILSICKALEQLMVPDFSAVKYVTNRVHPPIFNFFNHRKKNSPPSLFSTACSQKSAESLGEVLMYY